MASQSSVLTNMKRNTQLTLDGFNKWDYSLFDQTRSEDFIYQFLPLTLGTPARTKEEYREFFHSVMTSAFEGFKVTPKTLTFDVEAKRSVVYGHADVQSVIGPASIEFVMMLTFDGMGEKVVRIDEFFDSKVYSEFFAKLGELQKDKEDKKKIQPTN